MPNMSPKRNEMPTQDPNVRRANFKEVALGYTEEMALDEAKRCLNCLAGKQLISLRLTAVSLKAMEIRYSYLI